MVRHFSKTIGILQLRKSRLPNTPSQCHQQHHQIPICPRQLQHVTPRQSRPPICSHRRTSQTTEPISNHHRLDQDSTIRKNSPTYSHRFFPIRPHPNSTYFQYPEHPNHPKWTRIWFPNWHPTSRQPADSSTLTYRPYQPTDLWMVIRPTWTNFSPSPCPRVHPSSEHTPSPRTLHSPTPKSPHRYRHLQRPLRPPNLPRYLPTRKNLQSPLRNLPNPRGLQSWLYLLRSRQRRPCSLSGI